MEELDFLSLDELEPGFDHLNVLFDEGDCRLPTDEFGLVPGTIEYKQARRKRQNRESAVRSRGRKQTGTVKLKLEVNVVMVRNAELRSENHALRSENHALRQEIERYTKKKDRGRGNSGLTLASTVAAFYCLMCVMSEGSGNTPLTGTQSLKFIENSQPASYVFAVCSSVLICILVICTFMWYRQGNK